ncbi:DUF2398 family protein [Nocardiopsis sp. L17-MgMaSL7]|uniref:DUF2398 family protein n=1 Tax=Nocardiopsis sp. L17-MgMaSL7 TaxID=1938893 RepID=UPI000D711AD3|nr:DUF2398 family protein [Nocardiopsis sp. L17-MgMaSL7]PWV47370.1 uncharacterized protein (TIGR02678 family) [Nocardiopsis sp. L17-MgMaSL7]
MTRHTRPRVETVDLGSYQQAVRKVLTCDVITASRPRPGVLDQVLYWADQMTEDLRALFGYTLVATTDHVRLVRELDLLDPTQRQEFARKGRPFDRRRLAYLCLLLAAFQRSQVEISLGDLVRGFTPSANEIEGLGYDPTDSTHKAALVDVAHWLLDRGALHLSDGSVEAWARGGDQGDALFDIDHEICEVLFRPTRPIQHLNSASGLLSDPLGPDAPRERAAQRARRLLLEYPVVYYADVEPEVAAALRGRGPAEEVARLTGTKLERRAEGVLLADASGTFTDRAFPGRGGAVTRTAGLLLAQIATHFEESWAALGHLTAPGPLHEHPELVARIDAGVPRAGVVTELAWAETDRTTTVAEPASLPLVERERLEDMVADLFEEFGAASFTATWQQDPHGLLDAALALLTDLDLVRPLPGGVLVTPAALRYRNIRGALPERPDTGLLPFGPIEPADEPADEPPPTDPDDTPPAPPETEGTEETAP